MWTSRTGRTSWRTSEAVHTRYSICFMMGLLVLLAAAAGTWSSVPCVCRCQRRRADYCVLLLQSREHVHLLIDVIFIRTKTAQNDDYDTPVSYCIPVHSLVPHFIRVTGTSLCS